MKRVIFHQNFSDQERFDLNENRYRYLMAAMHTVARKVGYDAEEYYDGYCKFFMFGDTKENIPENIKIYDKVGFAHGTLTDCAYITDTKNQVEFMVTDTILVNSNGSFTDNVCEYDELGIPFLAELGRQLYDFELSRREIVSVE